MTFVSSSVYVELVMHLVKLKRSHLNIHPQECSAVQTVHS